MKLKTLSRPSTLTTRPTSSSIHPVHRNLDPTHHPFSKAREYTRALNAVKLDRVFAKPFVAALEGHRDGVYCLARDEGRLDRIVSGGGDGEIRIWSLSQQKSLRTISRAHTSIVKSIAHVPNSNSYISVSSDRSIKIWNFNDFASTETSSKFFYQMDEGTEHNRMEYDGSLSRLGENEIEPLFSHVGKHAYTGVHHHRRKNLFATSGGSVVEIWDHERSDPVHTFSWTTDSTTCVKFNQAETSVFASCASDRSVVLGDLRTVGNVAKVILEMNSNDICWNPMEPFIFAAANENHNVYIFDMRNLNKSLKVLKDHVSAVLSVDYSPTGTTLATGSYDRTIRLFDLATTTSSVSASNPGSSGRSRDVYHTKRMQRIWSVKWSGDEKYVVSGSDDGNVRIWKGKASEKLGVTNPRESSSLSYNATLIQKYSHMPEVKRIHRSRRVPKAIQSATKLKREMLDSRKRKEERFEKFSRHGDKADGGNTAGQSKKGKSKEEKKKGNNEKEKVVVMVEH
ncbi:WD40-repeat-containing domain protein [Paraphysoderma sedebokerense]|nr:WD40-repeat-containing domain protein [Paraphysoderma sedebokerense]